jgi:predicted DCC family thiol-disulfide oxidoreductase YuxK
MKREGFVGYVFYDGGCGLCTAGARRWEAWLRKKGFELVDMQSEAGRERLGLKQGEVPGEMKLRMGDGRMVGGVDAVFAILETSGWGWFLAKVGRWPGVHAVAAMVYRWVARRRHGISAACGLRR